MALSRIKQKLSDSSPATFRAEFDYCMACGIPQGGYDEINYPRNLENAHIVGGPGRNRQDDRRHLVRLCRLCHDLNHGRVIKSKGRLLVTLDLAHLLWIKSKLDPKYYDREELQRWLPKRLPRAHRPPRWQCESFARWRPLCYASALFMPRATPKPKS